MTPVYSDRFGYEPNLPDNIRIIFMWLCQEVVYVQQLWSFYLELFSSKDFPEIVDLAPASFRIIEESLRNDMTMSICRLSDPPKSIGKANLSFQTIALSCSNIDGVDKSIIDFVEACEPIHQLRNKMIGHNDLKTKIDYHNNQIPGIGRKNIEEILRLAKLILNKILQYHVSAEMKFEPIQQGGAEDLLFWLKAGKTYHDEHDLLILRGK